MSSDRLQSHASGMEKIDNRPERPDFSGVEALRQEVLDYLKCRPQMSGMNEKVERLSTGDVLANKKDCQILTMPNGDVLKEKKNGEIELKVKLADQTVDVKVKNGEIIVKRPHEKAEHFPAYPGVNLIDLGITIVQRNGVTTFNYDNGDRVKCDKEGVLDIKRGNTEEMFARLKMHAPPIPFFPSRGPSGGFILENTKPGLLR